MSSTAPIDMTSLSHVAAAFPDARLVVLFGSLARGQAHPGSDADIGISGCPFWRALDLGSALGSVLRREAHVVDLDTTPDLLRYEVARDGILIQETEPYAWVRFKAQAIVSYLDLKPIVDLCAEGARRRLESQARHG